MKFCNAAMRILKKCQESKEQGSGNMQCYAGGLLHLKRNGARPSCKKHMKYITGIDYITPRIILKLLS